NLMLAAQIPDAALVIGAVLAARESARQRDILPVPLLPCPSARQKFPITKDKDDPAWRRPQQALGLIGVGEGEAEARFVPGGHAAVQHTNPECPSAVHHEPGHTPFL